MEVGIRNPALGATERGSLGQNLHPALNFKLRCRLSRTCVGGWHWLVTTER